VVVRDQSKVKKRSFFYLPASLRDTGGSGGIALLILILGTWWRRVIIMLRQLSPDKEIPVHCEYEPQNRSVRFPNCKHCEIFYAALVDWKIITYEVYVEAKF
jgi:hypothetical protein